ncbi:hypothetical protein ACRALDRAFT_2016989 [Sodiomyces alcalophilus JCM 7366]|uniref:uncharacterized protein n=1 Tax=Sodiomyces alcalophilus JCM 7366 TaxID=591952 RepID=UPI0039B52DDB
MVTKLESVFQLIGGFMIHKCNINPSVTLGSTREYPAQVAELAFDTARAHLVLA